MLKPHEKLKRYWLDTGAGIITSSPNLETLENLEAKYGIQLPEDFRDYLLNCCPAGSEATDSEFTTWWPLDQIKNVPEEYPHSISDPQIARDAGLFLFFADHIFWCGAWAIHCGVGDNRGRVAVIIGQDRFVADSFAEFVDRYIKSLRSVV